MLSYAHHLGFSIMVPHVGSKGVLIWPLVFWAGGVYFFPMDVVGVYVLSWAQVEGLFTSSIVDCVNSPLLH